MTYFPTIALSSNWSFAPALSPWLILLGAVISIAAIARLYLAQRRIASSAVVKTLTGIRIALVLLVLAMLLAPARQWSLSRHTSGTLWLVLDGSGSMRQTDAQATPIERLEWADALGYLPADLRPQDISSGDPELGERETRFLAEHGSDPRVQSAMEKVAKMSRADLALAALHSPSMTEAMHRPDVRIVRIGNLSANLIVRPEKAELPRTLEQLLHHADGTSTNLAGALQTVSNNLVRDSSVLVISDGRQNVGPDPGPVARMLAARGARVFGLTIGSHELVRDAAVEALDAPDWVFTGDDVVVAPVVRLDGLKSNEQAVVEFKRHGRVIDQKTIQAKGTGQERLPLRFTDRPTEDGTYEYQVSIRPLPDEAVTDSNSESARVTVKHDKVKVLLVEDEPRWEYQFLRNYLARDHRVKLQAVLLEPGRIENVQPPAGVMASPDRGDEDIDAQVLPRARQDWSRFDVVILGDVPPERLGPDQQMVLSAALRDGGIKGLVLIAGPRNMPARFASAPLGTIVPVQLSGGRWDAQELDNDLRAGFRPAPALEGTASILSQFSPDVGINSQVWNAIPVWYWHSDLTQVRPGATTVWTIAGRDAAGASNSTGGDARGPGQAESGSATRSAEGQIQSDRRHTLLATMNYGLGRVVYLASPETWRLRYVSLPNSPSQVEDLHRRFWGQAIRWAAGSDLPAGGKFVRFGTDKPEYAGGEPIVVAARVLGQDFSPLEDQSFQVVAIRKDGSVAGQAEMIGTPLQGRGTYRGSLNLPPGSYSLSLRGSSIELLLQAGSEPGLNQQLQVEVQSDAPVEDRNVNTDPARMQSIAQAGHGMAVDGPQFEMLAKALPTVDRTDVEVIRAGLFTNPDDVRTRYAHWAFFAVFIGLITAEWVLRKRAGLI